MESTPTFGQTLIRVSFNPSQDDAVYKVKMLTAEIIDLVKSSGKDPRLTAIAITEYEKACMVAVKGLTG